MRDCEVSTIDAAAILGCSPQRVRELIHQGDLDAWRIGGGGDPDRGAFRVMKESIEELLQREASAERCGRSVVHPQRSVFWRRLMALEAVEKYRKWRQFEGRRKNIFRPSQDQSF